MKIHKVTDFRTGIVHPTRLKNGKFCSRKQAASVVRRHDQRFWQGKTIIPRCHLKSIILRILDDPRVSVLLPED